MASRPRIRRALDWVDSPAGGSTPWNMDALDDRDISASGNSMSVFAHVSSLVNLSMFPVYFAGAAALFICFFPGHRPSTRFARWVYLPAGLGLIANLLLVSYLGKMYPSGSVLESQNPVLTVSNFASLIRGVGTGFWSAIIGTLLVLYGDLRLRFGNLQLPVHFQPRYSARAASITDHSSNRFIWMMVSLPLLTGFGAFPALYSPALIRSAMGYGWNLEWQSPSWIVNYINIQMWGTLGLFVLLCFALGSARRETLRQSLRWPSVVYFVLGILLPAIIFATGPLYFYTFDRIHWAAHDFYRFEAPVFLSYFSLPQWPYLFLIPAALVEEIAWRGYLQPRFISRYGLYRGIFLVGIVWGVFHFPSDFNSRMTLIGILIHSVTRLLNCVSWGFALSWLTLRSRSVLPAALTHGLANCFIVGGRSGPVSVWFLIFSWTVLDIVLFRFWPPDQDVDLEPSIAAGEPPLPTPQLVDTLS